MNMDRGATTRNLLAISQLRPIDLDWIVRRGAHHAMQQTEKTLDGKVVGTLFEATSTRTRTAFTAAALRLGAAVVGYGPEDLQLNTGESYEDTARVLGSMLDALVVRSPRNDTAISTLAQLSAAPIINAMSASEHPTQAISDLTYLFTAQHQKLDQLRILYIGEGNNTAAALAAALNLLGGCLHLRTPAGYGLPPTLWQRSLDGELPLGPAIKQRHDLNDLPLEVDVVYTTRWKTTGTQKADPGWRADFEPFRITSDLLNRYPKAMFMHDLPAHRGDEVGADVIDGDRSVVFDQAEMKLYSAMAVIEWCMGVADAPEGVRSG